MTVSNNTTLAEQNFHCHQVSSGEPPLLEIPLDHPRPALRSFEKTSQTLQFDKCFYNRLQQFCVDEQVTLFTVLLAAFKTLLFRYTGQEDILVGSVVVTSSPGESQPSVHPIALRTNLAGDPTAGELLKRVANTIEIAMTIPPDSSFDRRLEPHNGHNGDGASLFQTMLVLCNRPHCLSEEPVSEGEAATIQAYTNQCDLAILVAEEDERLNIRCEYAAKLFEAATIRRLLGHFQVILRGLMAGDGEQPLSQLPILTEKERQRLLVEWNDTQEDSVPDKCIHQLFEIQAEQTPDAPALIWPTVPSTKMKLNGHAQLTYRELNERANQLAHYLRKLGVGPGVLVGICLERSFEMIIGLLGILKAGGVYVPLDPTYPRDRLAFMLEDTQAPLLLTQQRLVPDIPNHNARVVCIDADWQSIAQENRLNPAVAVEPAAAAYAIYTSGSTGKPKGVLGLHSGAVNRFHWMWSTYPFASTEICCQKTSLNFIDSLWEIFGPLLQGVPLVLIPDEISKDPYQLIQVLVDYQITRIVVVPSLLRMILDAHDNLQSRLPHLKYWTTSGEALPLELYQQFRKSMPESILLNLYGSSEVTADATWFDTSTNDVHSVIPIGRPITNMQTYILTPGLQPVPIGIPGELYIGGVGLAQGYLNRPKLTDERFIPNPFNPEPGARLFKTGDIARYLPDGNIEFLGRTDHQVKIRGIRIELGEIEATLRQHPTVQEAIVLVKENTPGDKQLVAYITPPQGQEIIISNLRHFLKEKLPPYMMPALFVVLDAFPLTPNGKVNRLALPVPAALQPETRPTYVAPQTDLEQTIAAIWQKILAIEKVGTEDNFFDLGGHSLLLAQIQSELHNALNRNIPIVTLLEYPTISSLSAHLSRRPNESDSLQHSHNRAEIRKKAIKRRRQLKKQSPVQ